MDNGRRRKRWHLHFTPTSSSWLNLVERWFAEITNKHIRRGTFSPVRELTDAIDHWVEHWNDNPQPFVWHHPAEQIIAKVQRGRAAHTGSPIPRRMTSAQPAGGGFDVGADAVTSSLVVWSLHGDVSS